MKKQYNYLLFYTVCTFISGIYFREITKYFHYTSPTALGKLHAHFMSLGVIMSVIMILCIQVFHGFETKNFDRANTVYNIGVIWTVVMMFVRGNVEVMNISLSKAQDAMISGIAGLGHIILTIGMFWILIYLGNVIKAQQ